MTARARLRKADVERTVAGALAGALASGVAVKGFRVETNGAVVILTDDGDLADDDWRSQQPLYRRA